MDYFARSVDQEGICIIFRCDEDLRRSMMKARLAENSRVSRSESPDTQLGESLLDPPNSLTRFPRRYQSPSRSGSPSLETPEHLICRPRPPAPQNSRPPDMNMVLGPAAASHPFSWTQARYPMTPIVHHTSMDSVCSPNAEALHLHQQHQLQQSPYRFDYSGSYQQYRRPQPVYNRPQMCWSQVQQVLQQKPQHVISHPQRTHLSLSSCSYDQQQKSPGQISPRGGKYQHYPEYQLQDQHEYHRPTGEYPDLADAYRNTRAVGDYQELDPYSRLRTMGEYLEIGANCPAFSGFRDQGLKRRGEYPSDWEYQIEHHNSKREYFQQPPYESEPSSSSTKKESGKCSTQIKQSHVNLGELTQEVTDLPKVMDDQLRPCCSHTGKHLCSSLEDLSEVGCKEESRSTQLHPKVSVSIGYSDTPIGIICNQNHIICFMHIILKN